MAKQIAVSLSYDHGWCGIGWTNSKNVLLCCIAKRDWWKEPALSVTFSQSDWFVASAPLSGVLFTTAHQPIRKQETAELC